jgi:hypothetical protein
MPQILVCLLIILRNSLTDWVYKYYAVTNSATLVLWQPILMLTQFIPNLILLSKYYTATNNTAKLILCQKIISRTELISYVLFIF